MTEINERAGMKTRKVNEIKWREDLYPRLNSSPKLIQEYAENIGVLPPIEINQNNEIIDGFHRWSAYRTKEQDSIPVVVTETESDGELLELAIERNATHGFQLSMADKRSMAQKIYEETDVESQVEKKEQLANLLSVHQDTVHRWVKSIDDDRINQLRQYMFDLFMSCDTLDEAVEKTGKSKGTIKKIRTEFRNYEILTPSNGDDPEKIKEKHKKDASFEDGDFKIPLYDVWRYANKSNEIKHYGNTEARIVDNLLYTFTEPFDIVVDPFAGGGSTIDVCKKRFRRYWVSDRKPIVAREKEIREHDVVIDGVSGPYHWGDVALVYLDPPYWKQAAGKYSDDPTDLANMPLDKFTESLIGIIEGYGEKMKAGSHIACIISPTQWPNEDKHTDYHDIDLACRVGGKLKLVRRVVCPYSTEQYNGTQVNIAKDKKLWMVLSRTMLVWKV